MKIVEIQAGVAIVMQISMNGQSIELPTVSVTVQDGCAVPVVRKFLIWKK